LKKRSNCGNQPDKNIPYNSHANCQNAVGLWWAPLPIAVSSRPSRQLVKTDAHGTLEHLKRLRRFSDAYAGEYSDFRVGRFNGWNEIRQALGHCKRYLANNRSLDSRAEGPDWFSWQGTYKLKELALAQTKRADHSLACGIGLGIVMAMAAGLVHVLLHDARLLHSHEN
jgi:hypothetical protein